MCLFNQIDDINVPDSLILQMLKYVNSGFYQGLRWISAFVRPC
jgi:hypothetical protein